MKHTDKGAFRYENIGPATKHGNINFGDMVINFMAEDSENKIENQEWTGIDDAAGTLGDLIYKSDFISERCEAARYLSFQGEVFVCLLKLDGGWVTEFFEISDYSEVKKEVTWFIGRSLKNRKDSQGNDLFVEWRLEGNKVVKTQLVQFKDDVAGTTTKTPVKQYTYPSNVTRIPGMIIRNNPGGRPDWYQVLDIIRELNLLATDIPTEWEKIKTIFRDTSQFGRGKDSQSFVEKLKAGKDVVVESSAVGAQYDVLMSGSTSLTDLINSIAFLEDRAMKYAFQGRDSDSSGTNKHNMQVGLFNQAHSEYVYKKIKQRQRDYLRFFNDIVAPIAGTQKIESIEITHSIYEEGKAAGMQQAIEQADLFKAQAGLADKQGEAAIKMAENPAPTRDQNMS